MYRRRFNNNVYLITSLSGKQYVGITRYNINARWKSHIRASKNGSLLLLSKAIRKYGEENFTIELIDTAPNRRQAYILEEMYILKLNTLWPHGYNMTPKGTGAVPGKSIPKSKETCIKISKIKTELYKDPKKREEQSKRLSEFYKTEEGKKISSKRKISATQQAKMHKELNKIKSTKEYREAKCKEQKEVWSNPELRKRHSEAIKETYRNGRVVWNKGKKVGPPSEETRRKISNTLKQRNGHT